MITLGSERVKVELEVELSQLELRNDSLTHLDPPVMSLLYQGSDFEPTTSTTDTDYPTYQGGPAPPPYPGATPQAGYQVQPGYSAQSGYQVQPGYSAQPGYPVPPGYLAQPGYPVQSQPVNFIV